MRELDLNGAVQVKNYTPLSHFAFEKHGRKGEVFDVIAVRGAFHLVHGSAAELAPIQPPVCLADRYYGEPETSSLKCESDLATFKPSTDVFMTGHARTLHGTPQSQWTVGVQVGKLTKAVRVTGPRAWGKSLMGNWNLGAPGLATEVPLHYELAYGGRYLDPRHRPDPGQPPEFIEHPFNPAGRGWASPDELKLHASIAAPQFEDLSQPVTELNQSYRPQGFGPICRWWQPRVQRAGTYDATWKREHFPDLPLDFDNAFYNSAHPDLIWKGPDAASCYLKGDEPLRLVGVFSAGPMESSLPGFTLQAERVDSKGEHRSFTPALDTIIIDTDTAAVSLIWRITLRREWNVRGVALHQGAPLQHNHPSPSTAGSRLSMTVSMAAEAAKVGR